MRFFLDNAGPHLRGLLPSGETRRRGLYVAPMVDGLATHPALEYVTRGDWSTLTARPTYRLRRGRSLRDAPLDDYLGYFKETQEGLLAFKEISAEYDRSDLRFQVSVPSPLSFSFIAFNHRALQFYQRTGDSAGRIWPYYRPVVEATGREISRIHELAGDVVFQLEIPAETLLAAKMPPGLRRIVVAIAATAVTDLAVMTPSGSRLGVHLCFGSLHSKPGARPRSTTSMVDLANGIVERWPAGRELEFVHIPMADGPSPPLHKAYYEHLRRLTLPPKTRLIAGIAHEYQPLDEQRRVLALVESAFGHQVDVASACGLGPRADKAAARKAIARAIDLATS
ncbi:hypothetical protein ABN034_11900 [Actinopolymorpha sp. B11F2]|uniref:hypothetical protein n=1 Tax=Actinopolymorpha sp. B11F2 TaxID=3160862 RepID=UPI0032E4A7A7